MKRSENRILTTHTGSLPRPKALAEMLVARETGKGYDAAGFETAIRAGVEAIVKQQCEAGLDVVNDGEMSKFFYATYIKERLTGFEGESLTRPIGDAREFHEFAARGIESSRAIRRTPACTGPIVYRGEAELERDLANLKAAAAGQQPTEVFLSAASPGVVSCFIQNQHYPDAESYVFAIADAMRQEYRAIHDAGFLLQLDCPDLAMGRNFQFADEGVEAFLANAALNVRALNQALEGIPPESVRLHLCWGNYEGPHNWDIELEKIVSIVLEAKVGAISLEGANPRHGHEWRVFDKVKLPDDKLLIPGVIDSTTNFIEHPDLVAERICRYAGVVGRERVIAGVDCGFSTSAVSNKVDTRIAWAKLGSLVEGARRASAELWG